MKMMTIVKKELKRFLTDRRMLITLILPGLLLYVLYSVMGSAMSDLTGEDAAAYRVVVVNESAAFGEMMDAVNMEIGITYLEKKTGEPDLASYFEMLKDKELDLLVVYPADFDAKVSAYSPSQATPAPNVSLYYNSSETSSSSAYSLYSELLSFYESTMTNRFDINMDIHAEYDLADERAVSGMIFSMMMPMLIIMLLFSGCMATAPESIAGEKERGTIATLLVTPLPRRDLALGKIIGVGIVSLISGLSSFLGVMLSLPKLVGEEAVSGAHYTATDYLILLGVMLTSVLLFVSMISVLSAYAKSVKEATALITPLMAVVTLVGVSAMFGNAPDSIVPYFIPVYGTVQVIASVFSFSVMLPSVFAAIGVNLLATAGFVFLLTRMFDSERIMFSR